MRPAPMFAAGLLAVACAGPPPVATAPTAAASAAADDVATIADLAWLSGRWVSTADDTSTEETWTSAGPDAMFGISRTTAGDRTVFFEYLRIEQTDDGLVYYASPKGRCPPVPFAVTEVADGSVRFENPAHDDPKSIAYVRSGDALEATVDGPAGERRWQYVLR